MYLFLMLIRDSGFGIGDSGFGIREFDIPQFVTNLKFAAKVQKIFDICKYLKLAFFIFLTFWPHFFAYLRQFFHKIAAIRMSRNAVFGPGRRNVHEEEASDAPLE